MLGRGLLCRPFSLFTTFTIQYPSAICLSPLGRLFFISRSSFVFWHNSLSMYRGCLLAVSLIRCRRSGQAEQVKEAHGRDTAKMTHCPAYRPCCVLRLLDKRDHPE